MGRDDQRQAVKNIPLEQLKPFKNHPFQVRDDEEFRRLVESIEIHGVIHPAVARQIGEDCYELISGHRRKAACEVLGYDSTVYPPLETVPRRFAISHRNRWMVETSDVVVAYVLHDWGGAAATLRCAKQKKKQIISYRDEMGS